MVRKQIYIREEQEALLKRTAHRSGITEAEIIRAGLDHALIGTASAPRDPAAWDRLKNAMDRRSALRVKAGRRRWTREELHDRTILR